MAGSEATGLSWFNILVLGCGLVVGAFIGYMLRLVTDVRKVKRAEKAQVADMIEQFRHARLGEAKYAKALKAQEEGSLSQKDEEESPVRDTGQAEPVLQQHNGLRSKAPVSEAFVESMLITFVNLRSAVRIAPENYLKEDDGLEVIEDTMKELLIAVNTIDEHKGEPINREKLQEAHNAAAAWLEKHISA